MNSPRQGSKDSLNPFVEEAAVGAAADALKKLKWEEEIERWNAHVHSCEVIMRTGVLPRIELAAEALRDWGNEVEVAGVVHTQTHTGIVHLRVKITVAPGTVGMKQLEFIASPKSMVIAAEASSGHEKKRWQKIALTSEGISGQCDTIIRAFLTWGWKKREHQ